MNLELSTKFSVDSVGFGGILPPASPQLIKNNIKISGIVLGAERRPSANSNEGQPRSCWTRSKNLLMIGANPDQLDYDLKWDCE